MSRKRYSAEVVIGPLRTIEFTPGKGLAVVDACRKLSITEQTTIAGRKNTTGCSE